MRLVWHKTERGGAKVHGAAEGCLVLKQGKHSCSLGQEDEGGGRNDKLLTKTLHEQRQERWLSR